MARRKGKTIFGVLRVGLVILAIVVAIPLVLTPVYGVVRPVSVPMVMRLLTGQPMERDWVDIGNVSPRLRASVIMSEDGQFCRHWGVDVTALRAEIDDFLAGRPTRGASTITMQVARNLFLWNDRSYIRKALEVPLAVYIDLVLSKKRILEIYLNIAEWGPNGQYGVAAGARAALGKSVADLSWQEAALLTVVLPNPVERRADRPTARLQQVAGIVEKRAQQAGKARVGCVM